MRIVWDLEPWDDYVRWQEQDRKVLLRINALLKDIVRGAAQGAPHEGIGKPEVLRHGMHGYWSRRITEEHRLVYKVVDGEVRIAACRFHYTD